MIFGEPLGNTVDYLFTVDVQGKTYGITAPAKDRKGTEIKLYFSLDSGRQVDFVDGIKKESDDAAKCDLSSFSGDAVMKFYKTDPQQDGVWPTGLKLVRQKTLHIENGD